MNLYCVIVTHNSATKIKQLVQSLSEQSLQPTSIIIVDNASKDNTVEVLKSEERFTRMVNVISLTENTGGAGGFRMGIEQAIVAAPDYVITFDDDVSIMDNDYLAKLVGFMQDNHYDIVGSLTLNQDNPLATSYSYKFGDKESHLVDDILSSDDPINDVKFFNGCLFTLEVLKELKGPLPDFFIRGDEQEFKIRVLEKGYSTATSKTAVIYHPSAIEERVSYKGRKLVDIAHLGKQYFSTRNQIYLYSRARGHNHNPIKINRLLLKMVYRYFNYYIFYKKDTLGFYIWLRAFIDGVTGELNSQYSKTIKMKYFN